MLKKRIIPKLLIKTQKIGSKEIPVAVTSKNFNFYRNVGNPISQAKIFQDQLADELLILSLDNKIISDVKVFDNYESSESRSIAIEVVMQSDDKTLTEQEISDLSERIIQNAKKKFNAKLR